LFPLGIGLAAGLAGSLTLTPLLGSQLVRVSAIDPLTMVVTSSVLAMSAAVACWIPARRATRVDPLVALRRE